MYTSIDNPGYQHAYITIANLDKADSYKSEGVEATTIDQLDK